MSNKIQDIITTFKGKTFSSHEEVVEWLESSLTSLLDSIEKEAPKKKGKTGFVEMIFNNGRKNKISVETNYDLGWNECLEEVINIINSHK